MPPLWTALNDSSYEEYGVDISQAALITNIQGQQPAVWVPDIVFPDAISITQTEDYLKLYPSGELRRMQHMVMTFSQSTMNYEEYPCGTQNITIRFFSFTLAASQLVFQSMPNYMKNGLHAPPVDFIYPQGSSTPAFQQNPVWTLEETGFDYTSWQLSPGLYSRPFGIVTFKISRKSTGILKRLCMPILLIMLLCALSYWSTVNDRIATTVTALLAIAALYIAIVGSIPLVGYMTRLDEYMLMMFIIIFTNTIFHMIVVRLNVQEKGVNWPLRKLTVRLIEFTGRVTMIPWIVITYLVCFLPAIHIPGIVMISLLLVGFEWMLLRRYLPELHTTVVNTIRHIELKEKIVARSGKVYVSSLELRFLAYVRPYFKDSLSHEAKENKAAMAAEAGRATGSRGNKGAEIELQPTVKHTQQQTQNGPAIAVATSDRGRGNSDAGSDIKECDSGTLNPLSS